MLTDCPDTKEVSDFHFLQIRTISIASETEIPSESVNIVASASKYGLIFIGVKGGFKVINLEDVLTLDEDKEIRTIETNYSSAFVPCGTPLVLAVNCSQTTLAVCIKSVLNTSINLYNLSAFSGSGRVWEPFCSNALSPPGIEVRDFAWNPAVEGFYAFCLSDGGLHLHEVTETAINPVAILQAANASSVCWSPKGKQLVAGKKNGSFSQYKPNMQEVKTIGAPPLDESPIVISSICWISNTVFAVVYVAGGAPNLFIVSTPKDSAVVYTNFNDVCLGNNVSPEQKYFFHLESLWGMLICASLDSIEIAVLGDMPNWVQWDLKEDGKALLPGKDGATHAIGMAVIYSAQRQIIISESESHQPMPILFMLTNNGLLVSFHMINTKAGAPSLVSPPVEFKKIADSDFAVAGATSNQFPSTSSQFATSSQFVSENASASIQAFASQESEPQTNDASASFGKRNSVAGQPKESSNVYGNGVLLNSLNGSQEGTFTSASKTPDKGPTKQHEVQSNSTDNSYMMAIISEIQSFTKEVQELKQLQSSVMPIESEEDMISLKTFSLSLHNFQNDIFETMRSVSNDIYKLKNVLLENFVMVEEACSRQRRRNDHSYITMLKERALDPITAKRMQKINQHYQYLRTQLQEVSDRLDQDWIHLVAKNKRNNPCIASTEAIYKTIVNNQKIIHNLKKKVNGLVEKVEDKKLRNTTKSYTWGKCHRSTEQDLSQLADEFLQVKIMCPQDKEPAVSKKLPTESQNYLKAFLKDLNVTTVRPTAVYLPSQSRLLSNAIPSEDFSGLSSLKNISSKQVSTPVTKTTSTRPDIDSKMISDKPLFENEGYFEPCAPVYEPITPPDIVSIPKPASKNFTTDSLLKTPLLKEQSPKPNDAHQSFSMPMNPAVIIQKDLTAPDISVGMESNKGLSLIPSSTGTTYQVPSEIKSSILTLPVFSQISPFSSCSETSTSKLQSTFSNNSLLHSEKNGTLLPITSPSVSESKNSSGTSQSIETLVASSSVAQVANSESANFSLPGAVTSEILTTSNNKNTSYFDTSQMRPFSQKAPDNGDQSISLPKDECTITSRNTINAKVNSTWCFADKGLESAHGQKDTTDTPNFVPNSFVSSSDTTIESTKTEASSTASSQLIQSISKPSVSILVSNPSVFSPVSIASTLSESTLSVTPSVTSTPNIVTLSDSTILKVPNVSLPSETTTILPEDLLGQNVIVCSPLNSHSNSDAVKKIESSAFGMKSPLFEKSPETSFFQTTTTATTTSTFTTTADTSVFGQLSVTQPSTFGQLSSFTSASDNGFFSEKPTFGVSATTTATTSANLDMSTTTFSFGKPAFGQNTSFSFGQNPNVSQNSNLVFGQGSFFSGLGAKPSEENASKNVFGISNNVKPSDTSSLFRNSGVSSFGGGGGGLNSSIFSGTSGSFSGGSGSVAQSGFGAFQQPSAVQQPGFGAAPAFGGSPSFGSAPTFGASPTFGSGNTLSSVFGQQQVSSNFSNFANASSPTFGSLASQGGSVFNTPPVGGGFGTQPSPPTFGSPAFAAPAFGSQTSNFGSPGSPPSNSSAFTQWRN